MTAKSPQKTSFPEKLAGFLFSLISRRKAPKPASPPPSPSLPSPSSKKYPLLVQTNEENAVADELERVSQTFFGIIEIFYQYIIAIRKVVFSFFRHFRGVGGFFLKIGAQLTNPFFVVIEYLYFIVARPVNELVFNSLIYLNNLSKGKKIYLVLIVIMLALVQSVYIGHPKTALIFGMMPFALLLMFINPAIGFGFFLLFGLGMLQYYIYGFPRIRLGSPLLLITMACYGIYVLSGKEKKFNIVYDNLLALICGIWSIMSIAKFLVYRGQGPIWGYLTFTNWFVVMAFGVIVIGKDKNRFFLIFYTVCFIYFLYAYQTVRNVAYYGFGTTYTVTAEVKGVMADNNELAARLNMIIPLIIGLALIYKKWYYRLPLIGVTLFFVLGVIYTNSRGGLLGLSVLVLPVIFMLILKNSKYKSKALAVILIILITGGVFLKEKVVTRYKTIGNWKTDPSAHNRILGTILGYRTMAKFPLFGLGPDGLYMAFRNDELLHPREIFWYWFGEKDYLKLYKPNEILAVHNAYFSCGGENGVFVLFLWLSVLFYFIFKMRRLRRDLKGNKEMEWAVVLSTSLELAVYSYMVTGWFLNNFYGGLLYVIMMLGISLDVIARKKKLVNNTPYTLWVITLFSYWLFLTVAFRYAKHLVY